MVTPDWCGTFWGSTPKGVPGKIPISITSQQKRKYGLRLTAFGDGFRRSCPDHVPGTRAHGPGQPLVTANG